MERSKLTQAFIMTERMNRLVEEILERTLQPHDMYEIAALLESMGWNDSRATKEFGVTDIFELAEQIWDSILEKDIPHPESVYKEKTSRAKLGKEMFRSFLRGLIFAFPMAVSVSAMLTLKFSLWSYKFLGLNQATAIAIGTIVSFVVSGGFTQAIARRGFFYIIQGYYNLARKSTFQFIWIGFGLSVLISFIMIILIIVFNLFTFNMTLLIVLFFFFLTSIWLSVTVMYILKKEIVFTGLIILGIGIVYVLYKLLDIHILISQLISLSIVSAISITLVLYFFRKEEKKQEKDMSLQLPKFSIIVYSVWPYFFYGFLYFSFLFLDRINAWSKNEEFMPYVIWFRGNYELGLDFALLTLIIPMGMSEVIVTKLMMDIEASQKAFLAEDSKKLYKKFIASYWRMYGFIFLGSIISAYLIYRLTLWYNEISMQINGEDLLSNDVTMFVLVWGIISYIILSFCLMNAVILFALSQPHFVIKSILPAAMVNLLFGFLLSRWVSYEFAVMGLLLGSIVMLILTTRYLLKVLNNLDYYLYAAS
jgi:hypothetical protein